MPDHSRESSSAPRPSRRRLRWAIASLLGAIVLAIGSMACQPFGRADGASSMLSTPEVENAYPHWSRDGKAILFQSNRSGRWQLYLMNADGSGERRLTRDEYNDNFPDWSPDNRRIAFVSDASGNEDIWIMNLDGSDRRNLTPGHSGRDIHPFWTPDGSRILFNSTRGTKGQFDVYSIDPDGRDLRLVRHDDDEKTCARLSPAGRRVVYLKGVASTGNDEVFAMNADGTGDTNLTRSGAAEGWPTWTPDGARIVFSRTRSGRFALWTMKADGSEPRQISFPPDSMYDARPNLSADGTKIVFNRQSPRTIAIYVMPLPPSGAR